jgi:predicted transcriptional regulator
VLSDAEWKVMHAVWTKAPVTARQVRERLPKGTRWAYTTVKTFLDRLVEKGALLAERQGGATVYTPRLSRQKARHAAVRALAEKAFDGAVGPMMHFLLEDRKLTAKERAELRRALREERR